MISLSTVHGPQSMMKSLLLVLILGYLVLPSNQQFAVFFEEFVSPTNHVLIQSAHIEAIDGTMSKGHDLIREALHSNLLALTTGFPSIER